MAESLFGLAKSAVEGTLNKFKTVIEEEAKLKVTVHHDLVFITGELQMMQPFLNLADKEHTKNNVVRTWVRQVRDLAYDVEDCIEFIVHLDQKPTWWWRVVPSCMAPVLPLDLAVAEIKHLKARVEDVSQRNMRYGPISDSDSKPVSQAKQPAAASSTAFDIISEVREAARKQRGLGDLTELITHEDSDRRVISVWGTGGDLGITSIIREAYDDPKICQDFTNRAWLKMMHPFNPDEFLRSLLTQFYANSPQAIQLQNEDLHVHTTMKAVREDDLMKEFMHQVKGQRYLVVLEDLSTVVEWDSIRMYLQGSDDCSRIIVSTQQLEIATLCMSQPYVVVELRQFSADHSVYAFLEDSYKLRERRFAFGTYHIDKNQEAQNWMDNNEIVGREREVSELARHMFSYRYSGGVSSVWGIKGVGKSALVKTVYYKDIISGPMNERSYKAHCWVDVPHPFNLADFSRRVLSGFHSEHCQPEETALFGLTGSKTTTRECCTILGQPGALIVIDGLCSTEEWDLIHDVFLTGDSYMDDLSSHDEAGVLREQSLVLPRSCGATIIVITNEATVATHCADWEGSVFNVKALNPVAALQLFTEKNGHRMKLEEPILTKFGGIPKVIVDAFRFMDTSKSWLWMDLSTRFMDVLETGPNSSGLRDLFAWMDSYFHTCPDSLRPCILYLSIFPPNYSIRRKRLVRRWIAEAYARDSDGSTAEENGEKFFSELVDLSMIEQPAQADSSLRNTNSEAVVECQVNGFFHEYIISRLMEDKLVFALEGHCRLNSQRAGRHLTIRKSWDRDINVYESIDFSRLRSLTVFGEWRSFFISADMKLLRVLDLEDTLGVKDGDLDQIGKLLPRLKFLSVRGCREISCLPSSLGGLRQLQTLDVTDTSIVTLPPAIIKLQKLQYIHAGPVPWDDGDSTVANLEDQTVTPSRSKPRTSLVSWFCRSRVDNGGVGVPQGIGKLKTLHTLGVINLRSAGGNGRGILKKLKILTQLHKLGVSGINRKNCQELCFAISGHGHLQSLSVRLDKDSGSSCLDSILPQKNLQNLELYGLVDKLPTVWISKLNSLRSLTLQMTMLVQEDIVALKDLPDLVTLRLFVNQFQDDELSFTKGQFPKVSILEVATNSELHLTFKTGAMSCLEVLKVHCCSGFLWKFTGIGHLYSIKEILLKGFYDHTLKQELEQQLEEHWYKTAIKLE